MQEINESSKTGRMVRAIARYLPDHCRIRMEPVAALTVEVNLPNSILPLDDLIARSGQTVASFLATGDRELPQWHTSTPRIPLFRRYIGYNATFSGRSLRVVRTQQPSAERHRKGCAKGAREMNLR